MIWILRYIGVQLWVTTLFAIPVSFYVIPQFSRVGLNLNPIFFGVLVLVLLGFLIGFFMNVAAKKKVISLIKEGQTWERSGLVEKAKKKYILALRAYDTFLLWPFSAQKTALKISSAIAGFQLNNHSDNQNLKLGTAVYLRMNPLDVDMAELWLTQTAQANIVTSFEQEVLSALAQAHMKNIRLLPLLANIFLGLQRSDLIAKKIYQQVMVRPDFVKIYQNRIQQLIGEPEENTIQRAVFSVPEQPSEKMIEIQEVLVRFASGLMQFIKKLWTVIWVMIRTIVRYMALFVEGLVAFFKTHEKFRFYLKTCVVTLFLAGFLFFMVSTLFHTFKTRTIEKKKIAQENLIPKPFTIQVAAYLKLAHAQNYVDGLKKKQVDASIKKVEGGGKTWFVIRVSQFADKKSAADYGNKLKQQRLIDDFFVNNR